MKRVIANNRQKPTEVKTCFWLYNVWSYLKSLLSGKTFCQLKK